MNIKSLIETVESIQNTLVKIKMDLIQLMTQQPVVIKIAPNSKMVTIPISKKTGKCRPAEFNPANQAAGAANGVKAAGVKKTKTVRRPRGSVGVKNMSVEQKREYWRWAEARKRQRRAGENARRA